MKQDQDTYCHHFFQHSTRGPSQSNKERKSFHQNWEKKKKTKVELSVDYVILYIGNPKDYTKMLFELISKLKMVSGHKINIQRSLIFTSSKLRERN